MVRAAALALLVAWQAAPAATIQSTLTSKPTTADMYVSCYLFARQTDVPKDDNGRFRPFSANGCALAALAAIAHREGNSQTQKYKFCLPNSAAVSADPTRAMAFAYLDFYPKALPPSSDGAAAFVLAMVDKWPCEPKAQ